MRALIIAAHPDDEVLGVGGTASVLAARGAEVHVLMLAEGVSVRHEGITLSVARERCHAASEKLGVADVAFGGFALDGGLLVDAEQKYVVDTIANKIQFLGPELVFSHHPADIHVDHRIAAVCTGYATRILGQGSVRQVLHFEVLSSSDQQTGLITSFVPNVFYDISKQVDQKCRALAVYDYELYPPPHPRSERSVRALAALRGTQVGVFSAEAFALGRELR